MPKVKSFAKDQTMQEPDNVAKLAEVTKLYGTKMSRRDVAKFLDVSLGTAVKWLEGLCCTGNLREKKYWTYDVVYRDISTQTQEKAS